MNIPSALKYTKEHEWLRVEGDVAFVGITDFAQGELGDIVFLEIETCGNRNSNSTTQVHSTSSNQGVTTMDVILLERISKLGQMGEVVRVKDGYARNFLLPRGKALRATENIRSPGTMPWRPSGVLSMNVPLCRRTTPRPVSISLSSRLSASARSVLNRA